MEKSIKIIEKSISSGSAKTKMTPNAAVGGLGAGVSSLSSATASFNIKNANGILKFTESLVKIVNSTDPKKIIGFGKFAQGFADSIRTVIEVTDPKNMAKLLIGSKVLFGGKNPLFSRILTGMVDSYKGVNVKRMKEAGKGITSLSNGMIALSSAMTSMIKVGIGAPLILLGALVTKKIVGMFVSIGKHKKEIDKAGASLKELGKGIVAFTAGVASLSLMLLLVPPKIILGGVAVLALYGLTVSLIGKAGKQVMEGSKSLIKMGLGLFAFSVGLSSFMLAVMLISIPHLLEGVAVLAAFTGIFWVIGEYEKEISQGALTLIIGISLGLFFFSGALMLFGVATQTLGWEGLALGTAVLTGLSGALYVIGKFDKEISKGAIAMAEMGVALIGIGAGLLLFGVAIQLFDWEKAAIGGAIILGLGLAFAGIGLVARLVAPGIAAVAGIGTALMSISGGILLFGVAIWALQKIFGDDLVNAGIIAGSILVGLGLAFGIIGVAAAFIAPGAAAMITVGFALMSVSGGILLFGLAIKGLQNIFGDDLVNAGIIARGILLGLGLTFAAIGVLGVFVMLGSAAGIVMGLSLSLISFGLWTFGNTIKGLYDKDLIDKDGGMKGVGILSQMMTEFAKMFFTSIFALPGIAATIGMGISLMVVAKGLRNTADVIDKLPDDFLDKLFKEDTGFLDVMAQGFIRIGKKYSGGLLSSFLGVDPLSLGVRTVKGIGGALQEVAGGIAAFADFTKFPIQIPNAKDPSKLMYTTVDIFGQIIPSLQTNLPPLLTVLADMFGDIGNKWGGDGGWFGSDSPVQKGIDAIAGMGSVLSELAGGIVAFANFDEFPIQSPDPKDPSKLIYKSVNLYDQIPKIAKALIGDGSISGKVGTKTPILFALAEVFATIGTKYAGGFFSDNKVKQGIDAVAGIGSTIADLAEGILGFADIERGLPICDENGKPTGQYKAIDLVKVNETIQKVLQTIPGSFAKVDLKLLEDAQTKAKKYGPINDIVSEMTGYNYEDASKGMDAFGKSLVSLGTGFASFATGFTTFTAQLTKFEKFEKSMSNLIKGQYKYKFGKFAKDMGTFKTNVNSFDVQKLKLTESMLSSIAAMAKSPESLSKIINGTLEKSFAELIEAIRQIVPEAQAASGGGSTSLSDSELAKVSAVFNSSTNSNNTSVADMQQMMATLIQTMTGMQNDIAQLNLKFTNGTNGGILITDQ